jgi:hypothetical protein
MSKGIPIYVFKKGNGNSALSKYDDEYCGGDCASFIENHFELNWSQITYNKDFKEV